MFTLKTKQKLKNGIERQACLPLQALVRVHKEHVHRQLGTESSITVALEFHTMCKESAEVTALMQLYQAQVLMILSVAAIFAATMICSGAVIILETSKRALEAWAHG